MKFKVEDGVFLDGSEYSNGHRFYMELDSQDSQYVTRNKLLVNMVEGKKLVHFGCVDHDVESIRRKNDKGKWLHKLLTESSQRCLGIDIKEDECRFIRDDLGYDDIECVNILENRSARLESDQWDMVLLPDVIEHIPVPGSFLKALRMALSGRARQLVVTTPNGLSGIGYKHGKKGHEVINTDHRMVFTPFTLSKLLVEAGFKVDTIRTCRHGSIKRHQFIKNFKFQRYPLVRDCLVVVAHIEC